MRTFLIVVTEQLSKGVEVQAETFDQAYKIVREQYHKGDIALSSEDFFNVEFMGVHTDGEYFG